ncbi:MAG: Ig-like domain-containing protein [Spirochaetota bacterium]
MKKLFVFLLFVFFSAQSIYCNPTNPWENENDSGDVSSASAVNNTQVEVVFSTNVEESSAETAANYSIKTGGTILAVSSAERDASDNTIVRLVTSKQENVEYTLVVNGVKTIPGGNATAKTINTTNDPDKFIGDGQFYVEGVTRNSGISITIQFSKTVDAVSGGILSNYTIDNSLNVTSASVSGNTVTLGTGTQVEDITYKIIVTSSVLDANGNTIDPLRNSGTFGYIVYPKLVSATWKPNRIVDLEFSEPVNETTAETATNYSISSGLAVTNAERDTTYTYIVHLTTDYQADISYTIAVNGVTDITGNAIDPDNDTATFAGNASPIVVSIVVFNPHEYIRVIFSEAMLNDGAGFGANNYLNYSLLLLTSPSNIDKTYHISDFPNIWFSSPDAVTIELSPNLPDGNYRLIINSNVQDLSGNSLKPPVSIDFIVP